MERLAGDAGSGSVRSSRSSRRTSTSSGIPIRRSEWDHVTLPKSGRVRDMPTRLKAALKAKAILGVTPGRYVSLAHVR
jgi:hypothetical protein